VVEILHGDSRQVLDTLPDNSIHACVTDPPYALASIVKRFGAADAAPARGNEAYKRISAGFMGQKWDTGEVAMDAGFWRQVLRVLRPGAHVVAFGGTRTYHRLACAIEDAGFEIRDQIGWLYGSGMPKSHNQKGNWQGWGTGLKPAWEPIVLARKPLTGTVAANLAAWQVGALHVAATTVPFAGAADEAESKTKNAHGKFGSGPMTNQVYGKFTKDRGDYDPEGRWPANVIHDGSDDVLASLGEPSRFFYCAKASRSDRNDGLDGFEEKPLLWSSGTQSPGTFQSDGTKNNHPTVKPTELMRYLCRLITPAGGTILDPFMGSGSTGRGAVLEGFDFIGVEQDAGYLETARARIAAAEARVRAPDVSEVLDAFA
jgi:site-specific DNA-methyltransferase (adenine-specific)